MTNLFKSDAIRTVASISAALVLSATFTLAAVGPARAAATPVTASTTPVAL